MILAVEAGATTPYEIARQVQWNVGHFDTLNYGTQRAAVMETLSHLRYLVGEGRLHAFELDGVSQFELAPRDD
jgi:hypothetical protein